MKIESVHTTSFLPPFVSCSFCTVVVAMLVGLLITSGVYISRTTLFFAVDLDRFRLLLDTDEADGVFVVTDFSGVLGVAAAALLYFDSTDDSGARLVSVVRWPVGLVAVALLLLLLLLLFFAAVV